MDDEYCGAVKEYRTVSEALRKCKFNTEKEECEACYLHTECKKHKGFVEDYAADLIERIGDELNAAVADLSLSESCRSCKNNHIQSVCKDCIKLTDDWQNPVYYKTLWEWRGL